MIGVNHFDPLGREKINIILNELSMNSDYIPECFAVGWDKTYANIIRNQRPYFIQLAREYKLDLKEETILALADSIAYESDSHKEKYPNVPIAWLDERNKGIIPDYVEHYAEERLKMYLGFLDVINVNKKMI